MHSRFLLFALAAFLFLPNLATSQDEAGKKAEAMAKMMELWQKWAVPDKHHKELEYFLGNWDTETRTWIPDAPAAPPTKGEATFSWLIDGRFLSQRWKGSIGGMPAEGFSITGFDRFKKKWVTCLGSNMATAIYTAEGVVVDPTGKVRAEYGNVDEFLTGEHDKEARYVTRRIDDDTFTYEVWDLGIGAEGAKVVEVKYTRRK